MWQIYYNIASEFKLERLYLDFRSNCYCCISLLTSTGTNTECMPINHTCLDAVWLTGLPYDLHAPAAMHKNFTNWLHHRQKYNINACVLRCSAYSFILFISLYPSWQPPWVSASFIHSQTNVAWFYMFAYQVLPWPRLANDGPCSPLYSPVIASHAPGSHVCHCLYLLAPISCCYHRFTKPFCCILCLHNSFTVMRPIHVWLPLKTSVTLWHNNHDICCCFFSWTHVNSLCLSHRLLILNKAQYYTVMCHQNKAFLKKVALRETSSQWNGMSCSAATSWYNRACVNMVPPRSCSGASEVLFEDKMNTQIVWEWT